MTMAAALRSCRSLGRSGGRRRLARSISTTTDSTVLNHEPRPLPIQPQAIQPQAIQAIPSDRRKAIKEAKPFSEFLTDNFNRQHDYLRISVTERCNLRCLYCMPEEGVPLSPPEHLLTTPEIFYISSLFVSQGVTKIRLTGGEPTVRPDILPLMQQIGSLRTKGLRELALTTNGISLHRKLDKMVEAGLTAVNISLDTLDPFQFQILTRRKGYDAVIKSIGRVLEMNRQGAAVKLKVNCVVMRGINEREIIPFVEMGREKDIEVRFIEYMPFGGNKWSQRKMLTYLEMLDIIREKYPNLRSVRGHRNDTSKTFEIPGFVGKIGFITSMTEDFCGTCNRLRITGDGNLKVCLHGNTEVSLRDIIRKDNAGKPINQEAFEAIRELELSRHHGLLTSDQTPRWSEREAELLNVIGGAVKRKKEKHAGMGELENMENRPMILIAEGNARSKLPYSRKRTSFGGSPWSNIPIHLLHSDSLATHGARMYSTSSEDRDTSHTNNESSDRPNALQSEAEASSTDPGVDAEPAFQSLRSLFGGRIRNRALTSSEATQREEDTIVKTNKKTQSNNEASAQHNGTTRAQSKKDESKAQKGRAYDSSDFRIFEESEAPIPLPPMEDRFGSAGDENVRWTPPVDSFKIRTYESNDIKFRSLELGPAKPLPPWQISKKAPTPSYNIFPGGGSSSPNFSQDREVKSTSSPATSQTLPAKDKSIPPNQTPSDDKPATASTLTHLTSTGEAHMVDVGHKDMTDRVAVALGVVQFANLKPYQLITENANKKGDVLGVARIAGIMAAKKCSDIIPLCHPIPITKVQVDVKLHEPNAKGEVLTGPQRWHQGLVSVEARVHCHGRTGVEMEALTAVSAACLTVYDMCKAVDKMMRITEIRLVLKDGGKESFVLRKWENLKKDQEKKEKGEKKEQKKKEKSEKKERESKEKGEEKVGGEDIVQQQ